MNAFRVVAWLDRHHDLVFAAATVAELSTQLPATTRLAPR